MLRQAIRRAVRRVFRQKVSFSGNREAFRLAFLSQNSIRRWVLISYRYQRQQFRALLASGEFPHLEFVEGRNPKEASESLTSLAKDIHRQD